jgi:hypothetical protein
MRSNYVRYETTANRPINLRGSSAAAPDAQGKEKKGDERPPSDPHPWVSDSLQRTRSTYFGSTACVRRPNSEKQAGRDSNCQTRCHTPKHTY